MRTLFPIGPTQPRHLVRGALYAVKGTASDGTPIPAQVIQPLGPIQYSLHGQPLVDAQVWVTLHPLGVVTYRSLYPLTAVQVGDKGASGWHDRHLERLPHAGALGDTLGRAPAQRVGDHG